MGGCIIFLYAFTQRPSAVRINLKGDVPSVPIPLAKRKPSLKQPAGGGQRVSLYVPEKKSVEHSGSSFWLFLQQQKPRASMSGSTVASSRFSHAAGWFFGKQKARSRRRAAVGWAIHCTTLSYIPSFFSWQSPSGCCSKVLQATICSLLQGLHCQASAVMVHGKQARASFAPCMQVSRLAILAKPPGHFSPVRPFWSRCRGIEVCT